MALIDTFEPTKNALANLQQAFQYRNEAGRRNRLDQFEMDQAHRTDQRQNRLLQLQEEQNQRLNRKQVSEAENELFNFTAELAVGVESAPDPSAAYQRAIPQYIRRAQALGLDPGNIPPTYEQGGADLVKQLTGMYRQMNPQNLQLKEIYDPEKGTTTYGTEQQALGKQAPPKNSPSSLAKLIEERNELAKTVPPDDPRLKAYDNKISGVDIDIENLTPEEIDMWGNIVNLTGKMPALGRGKQATKIRAAIVKSAARQALGGTTDEPGKTPSEAAFDVIGQQTDTKSITEAQKFLEKQVGSMGSFVRNIGMQVNKVRELSKDLETYDARLLNIPLRALRGKLAGSALQAKYDMYLTEIESEIGKLATGSSASIAELSTSAQERWDKIHDKNLNVKDMLELLSETKNAAQMRLSSVNEELNNTRNKMRTRNYGDNADPLGIR